MIAEISQWLEANRQWLTWLGLASMLMVILSVLIVPILVVKMQPDHFVTDRDLRLSVSKRHPLIWLSALVARNLVGGLLVIGGILLSLPLIPGQGLLTILIGLAIMDFPGKRKLELRLVKLRPVSWAISKLRQNADQPPLILPTD